MSAIASICASIIICTCNRSEHLVGTLAALEDCLQPQNFDARVELIIVDNASTDDTSHLVRNWHSQHYAVKYIYEPRRGKGNAYNAGIQAADGCILIFTDDDVRPEPMWLRNHVASYADPDVCAVQGRVTLDYETAPPDWMTATHRSFLAEAEFGAEIIFPFNEALVGANMSLRRDAARAVGEFNPLLGPGRAGFADDSEFSERLVAMGLKQMYQPSAAVRHVIQGARLNRAYFVDVAFRLGVSRSIILAQHGSVASRFNVLTLGRATAADLKRRVRSLIAHQSYYGTDPHLWYINYLGIAWGNLLGLERLKRRYTAQKTSNS